VASVVVTVCVLSAPGSCPGGGQPGVRWGPASARGAHLRYRHRFCIQKILQYCM